MTDEYTVIRVQIQELQESLFNFLRKNKVQVPDKKISSLLQGLEDIKTIVNGHNLVMVVLDELGYITGYSITDSASDKVDEIPEDLGRGYYKMDENGRFIRDDEKYERYWRTFY